MNRLLKGAEQERALPRDTRHLIVATEHLRTAYGEIAAAQGCTERAQAEAAVERALSHLHLAQRRLLKEPLRSERHEAAVALREGCNQEVHTILNEWPAQAPLALESPRGYLLEAIEQLEHAAESALASGVMEA